MLDYKFNRKSGNELEFHRVEVERLSAIESTLLDRYLGDDFTEIVRAGEVANDSTFIAGAGLPIEQRTKIFRQWRAQWQERLIEDHESAAYFLDDVGETYTACVRAGGHRD